MQWPIERLILTAVYAVGITALVIVPAKKRKQAHAVFLFQGMIAWILGLIVVEAQWIQYPVRELYKSSSTSFLFEFLIFPMIGAYYNIYYPEGKSLTAQVGWLMLFAFGITLPELFIEKFTLLISYTGWQWYWTSISVSITLCLSRLFDRWFFRRGVIQTEI